MVLRFTGTILLTVLCWLRRLFFYGAADSAAFLTEFDKPLSRIENRIILFPAQEAGIDE
jgi:hypothetical protein